MNLSVHQLKHTAKWEKVKVALTLLQGTNLCHVGGEKPFEIVSPSHFLPHPKSLSFYQRCADFCVPLFVLTDGCFLAL